MNARQAKKIRKSYHDCCGGYLTRGLRHWYKDSTVDTANRVVFRNARKARGIAARCSRTERPGRRLRRDGGRGPH